ncbi:MAG: bacteriocin-protection protein, YdeI/OmpD-associated family, partial [Bacteroidetes bacterium]|nr:bacteriocin-protection protein, YdeI/OmpD-associated family [Bacteroidota bacterium]
MIEFKTAEMFETWLEKNFDNSRGLWIKIFKKNSGKETISYAQALDVALCFGWIDGQKQSLDKQAWLQKFCPRTAKSIWSKVNIGHVERLIREGKMRKAGLTAVENAKEDGRWENA